MGNKNLQDLAKAHARREISTSDYRRLRSELLDRLTGDDTSNSSDLQSPASNDAEMPHDAQLDQKKSWRSVVTTIIQFCLLIALIGGFFYFFLTPP